MTSGRDNRRPGILAFMRPMPPKLIIPHKLSMPVIYLFAFRAADDIGIEHAALDRKAAFRAILPGMALRGRRPLDLQLAEGRLTPQRPPHDH